MSDNGLTFSQIAAQTHEAVAQETPASVEVADTEHEARTKRYVDLMDELLAFDDLCKKSGHSLSQVLALVGKQLMGIV